MSAQAKDTILINGKKYTLCGSPIFDYWKKNNNKPRLLSFNTGLHRGFYAGWEILNSKLYLINFYGENYIFRQKGGITRVADLTLKDLFPNEEMVFAEWYTGEIKIPFGEQIDYSHSLIGPIFEASTSISIHQGCVINSGIFSI